MTHHTDERAEFEAWAQSRGMETIRFRSVHKYSGEYFWQQVQDAWSIWQELQSARRAQVVPAISEAQVLAITTAYEQGVGKGHQSHARKEAITNPYGDEWGCDSAWQMGYDEGRDQAERKAAAPQPPEE